MILWLLIVLAFAAAVCFFVDAAAKSWTARGLFLLALSAFIWLLNQAV